MASSQDFLNFVIDQIKNQELVRSRKMFGEYAIYYDEKVVGFVCDNILYLKNTEAGRNFVKSELGQESLQLGQPYPKAKDYIKLEAEIENRDFLNELIEITRENI